MGLLDFLKKLIDGASTQGTEEKSRKLLCKGDGYELWEYETDDLTNYRIYSDTLKELKVYDEKVESPCGFDFSAVRRCRSQKDVWWSEGENYKKIAKGIDFVLRFEKFAKDQGIKWPSASQFIKSRMRPYEKGAMANYVPTIRTGTHGGQSTVDASVDIQDTELGPHCEIAVKYGEDGNIVRFVYSYNKGNGYYWNVMKAQMCKCTGKIEVQTITYGNKTLYKRQNKSQPNSV